MKIFFASVVSLFFICSAQVTGAEEFVIPKLTGSVIDQTSFLSPTVRAQLEQFLRAHKENGGAQIQVAILESLGGLSIEEASIKLVDEWKLGDKKTDRGLLLLVAPNDRKVRIEVGQGLEGDLPDAIASRVVNEVITPRFKSGDRDGGVVAGIKTIIHYTDPQIASQSSTMSEGPEKPIKRKINWIEVILLILGLGFFIFNPRRLIGGGFGGRRYGGGGGFGGGSSGGSWSGGGGGFSGGGSSGSW